MTGRTAGEECAAAGEQNCPRPALHLPPSQNKTLFAQPAVDQRLLSPDGAILVDASTLAEAGIVNDAVLGLCHRQPGKIM